MSQFKLDTIKSATFRQKIMLWIKENYDTLPKDTNALNVILKQFTEEYMKYCEDTKKELKKIK